MWEWLLFQAEVLGRADKFTHVKCICCNLPRGFHHPYGHSPSRAIMEVWEWERPQLPDGNTVPFCLPLLLLADLIPDLAWLPGTEISFP